MGRTYHDSRSRQQDTHRYHFVNEQSHHISRSHDSVKGRSSQYAPDSNWYVQRRNCQRKNIPYRPQYNGWHHPDLRSFSMHSTREEYENFHADHWSRHSETFAAPVSSTPLSDKRKCIKHNKQAVCKYTAKNSSDIKGIESCSVREKEPKKSECMVKPGNKEKLPSTDTSQLIADNRINGRNEKKTVSSNITPSVVDNRTKFRTKRKRVLGDNRMGIRSRILHSNVAQSLTDNKTEFRIKKKHVSANTGNRMEVQTRKKAVVSQPVSDDRTEFKIKQKCISANTDESYTDDSINSSKKKTGTQMQIVTHTCSDESTISAASSEQSVCSKSVSSEFVLNDKRNEKNYVVQSDVQKQSTKEIMPQPQSPSAPTLRVYDRGVIRRLANDTCRSMDKAKLKLLIQEHLKKSMRPSVTLSKQNGETSSDPKNGETSSKQSSSDLYGGINDLQASAAVAHSSELKDKRDIYEKDQVTSSSHTNSSVTRVSSGEPVKSNITVVEASSTCPRAADGHTGLVPEELRHVSSVLGQEGPSVHVPNTNEISQMSNCTVKVEMINDADVDHFTFASNIEPAFSLMDLLASRSIESQNDFPDPTIDAIKNLETSLLNLSNCSADKSTIPCEVELSSSVSSSTDIENARERELQYSDAPVGTQMSQSLNLIHMLQQLAKHEDHLRNQTRDTEQAMSDLLLKVEELKMKLDQLRKGQEELQQTRRRLLLEVQEFLRASVQSTSPHVAQASVASASHQVSVTVEHKNVRTDYVQNRKKSNGKGSARVGQETNKPKAVSSVLPDSSSEVLASNITVGSVFQCERKLVADDNPASVPVQEAALPLDVGIHSVQHKKVHDGSISCIEIHGNFIFIGGDDGVIQRIKLDDESDIIYYMGHRLQVTNMYVNGLSLYTAGCDGLLLHFTLESGNLCNSAALQSPILSMCEGWQNLYIGLRSGEVSVFSLVRNTQVDAIKCSNAAVSSIATTSQGAQRLICIASHDTFVTVWDASTKLLLRCLEINIPPSVSIQMKVLHNFVYINSLSYSNQGIHVYELLSGERMQTISLPSYATSFFVMDGWIAATSVDGNIRFFRNNSNVWSFYAALKRFESLVAVTCMTGNSSLIVTANVKGTIEAFDLESN